MNLLRLSAGEICKKTVSGELDPVETVDVFLQYAGALSNHNSFISLTPDLALESAEAVRNSIASGDDPGILAGVPVGVKDSICIEGHPTTCGSRILDGFCPPYNATAVSRLIKAGAIVIGKTNMDEFAMGSSSETSCYGPVSNPHNRDYSPGGSSGGSAVAVASFQTPLALGSDTGGSIRQPASLTGIVGLKPTYGAVSRYGLIAHGSSLDQIGPMARSVKDTARLLAAISSYDSHDSTSADCSRPDYLSEIDDYKPCRIGLPVECFGEGLDDDVRASVASAIGVLESLGCEIVEMSLPHSDKVVAAYYVIATAEASSNLARYDGVEYGHRSDNAHDLRKMYLKTRSEGFGEEVKRRIMLGTFVLSSGYAEAYYHKAAQVRQVIRNDLAAAFENADIIITPTSPTAGIKLGEKLSDPLSMYLSDIYTVTANLTGSPAVSLPCGYNDDGMPIGLQMIGRHFDELALLQAAKRMEAELRVDIGVRD